MEIQKKQEDADKKYKEERLDPVLKHLNYTREGDVIKNEKGEDLSVAEKIELYTKTHFSRAYLGVKQKEQELKDLAQRVREDVQTGLEYIEGLPQKAKDLGESISNKGKGIAEAISESIRILRSGDHEIPVIERTETKTVPIESGEKPPVKDESISMRSDDPTIMSIYKQNLRLV
jgi:hypothetical protein